MTVCKTRAELRKIVEEAKKNGKSIGLVPTMGALHEGHGSLIAAARPENDLVIVSIFVNPTQFAPNEDLDAYPRTLDTDVALAESLGADIIFAPTAKEMYPSCDDTWVEVTGNITKVLCGKSRPTHFRGVTTVVTKLFLIACPDRAYFGQKDAQQVHIIRRMVKDLFFPLELRILPIIREHDGLAKSSRNVYLSPEERKAALVLSQSLSAAEEAVRGGERSGARLVDSVRAQIACEPMSNIEYVELHTLPDLTPVTEPLNGAYLLAVAVRFGTTRLIDNTVLEVF
ncbi:MAG: pantoate--beta-alanine ligase [Clostridiales Family XIII bacterium]|jgi:pantoate--beta-alanine ligase|nr:pantoate--beta-alanine ligase [Clostridiales Family XIII bacterium]